MPENHPPADDAPIGVLIVEDHPALRAGLVALLGQEPGLRRVAAVGSERELLETLPAARPDVVVLDYVLGRGDGLRACFRLKQRPAAPRVVLYSGYADGVFAVPASVAQADAIVSKSAPVERLLHAIRSVSRDPLPGGKLDAEQIHAASGRLRDGDLPVLGMLAARHSVQDIADTLHLTPEQVSTRALRIIGRLQALHRLGEAQESGNREEVSAWAR